MMVELNDRREAMDIKPTPIDVMALEFANYVRAYSNAETDDDANEIAGHSVDTSYRLAESPASNFYDIIQKIRVLSTLFRQDGHCLGADETFNAIFASILDDAERIGRPEAQSQCLETYRPRNPLLNKVEYLRPNTKPCRACGVILEINSVNFPSDSNLRPDGTKRLRAKCRDCYLEEQSRYCRNRKAKKKNSQPQ
jgi:hypothetical protein